MVKTLKKFCSILKFLEQNYKDLYQAIVDLCLISKFKKPRITFLLPTDKKLISTIVDHTYSNDPKPAVDIINALIIPTYCPLPKNLDGAINLLGIKLPIASTTDKEAKFTNGLTATVLDSFKSMRDGVIVYGLHGKEMFNIDGPRMKPNEIIESKIAGGYCCSFSQRENLHKLLENKYSQEIETPNNIYVKKVTLHLKLLINKLQNAGKSTNILLDYLGNDEFSDSYLLDMYCEKHCDGCFETLKKCLEGNDGNCDVRVQNIDVAKYISVKKSIVGEGANDAVNRTEANIRNISSPMDIRIRVCELYGGNKHRLGRDLFIVFCNVARDLWETEKLDKVGVYKNFAYIASKVYKKTIFLVNQEFDIAANLTSYGNLLKSDVLLYVPQAEFKNPRLKIPVIMPNPLDLSLFSLCGFINKPPKVSGGMIDDPEVSSVLNGL